MCVHVLKEIKHLAHINIKITLNLYSIYLNKYMLNHLKISLTRYLISVSLIVSEN